MIDAVPVNILSFSASGEPTYINKRYQDYLGLSVPSFDISTGTGNARSFIPKTSPKCTAPYRTASKQARLS